MIFDYFVNLANSLTILSHEGCKSEIPILDFDEFLPAKFDQRKNIFLGRNGSFFPIPRMKKTLFHKVISHEQNKAEKKGRKPGAGRLE